MNNNESNGSFFRDNKENKKIKITEKIIGRSLPFSIEAERAVLGSILLHDNQINIVEQILHPTDFYMLSHQIIYETMLQINSRNKKIDIITLQDELNKSNNLNNVGNVSYIISLQEDILALGLIEQHAKIIKEKSILRNLINSATQIISNCYAQDEQEIDSVLDSAEKTIFEISQKRVKNNFVQLNIWLTRTFKHLNDIKTHKEGITGIPSGYKKLDILTSGFQKGDFIVLAARPSMGKTALALSMGLNAAMQDLCVGIFSLEMSAEQLTLRLLSAYSGIPHYNIRNARVSSDEWKELVNVSAQLSSLKFFIDDNAIQNIMDIRAKARKLKMDHNLDFLIIDYLQLLNSGKKHENRHQEVSDISRALKSLAKELNIPIIALSQLSRAVDSRVDKRPILSDLRESGAIEQDADLIMFLYRDVVYNPETEDPEKAELIIGKHRNGSIGSIDLQFHNQLTLFQDYE